MISLNREVTCREPCFFSPHLHHAWILRGDPFGFGRHLVLLRSQALNSCTDGPAAGIPGDATGTVTACQRRACEKLPLQQFDYAVHNSELWNTDVCCVHSSVRALSAKSTDSGGGGQPGGGGLSGSLLMCACVCSSGEFSLSVTYGLFTAGVNHARGLKLPEVLIVLVQENSAGITSSIEMTSFFTI